MSDRPWHDKRTLESLYHGEGLSQEEIGDRLGCSRETVVAWMKKLEVETRHANETRYLAKRERLREEAGEIKSRYLSGDPLYALAEDFDVQDQTMRRFLEDQGVETRDISEQLRLSFSTDRVEELDVATPVELRDATTLREMYVGREMSSRDIARELGCSSRTVIGWLDRHGIETRSRTESVRLGHIRPPALHTGRGGYEYIHHAGEAVRHHRLLATLLVDDLSELKGMHVHHRSGVEWDNRLSSLEVLDFKSHMAAHREAAHE